MAAVDLKIEVNSTSVRAATRKLEPNTRNAVAKSVLNVVLVLERDVKTKTLNALTTRTGNTRRAVFSEVRRDSGGVTGIVGVDLKKAPGARIQEFGGTVRPKRAKNLTIPLGQAKTAGGVARFTARDVISRPESFGYTGTFTRNRIIFGTKEGGKAEPLFALRSSVTLKPVGYLAAALNGRRQWIKNEVKAAAVKAGKDTYGTA